MRIFLGKPCRCILELSWVAVLSKANRRTKKYIFEKFEVCCSGDKLGFIVQTKNLVNKVARCNNLPILISLEAVHSRQQNLSCKSINCDRPSTAFLKHISDEPVDERFHRKMLLARLQQRIFQHISTKMLYGEKFTFSYLPDRALFHLWKCYSSHPLRPFLLHVSFQSFCQQRQNFYWQRGIQSQFSVPTQPLSTTRSLSKSSSTNPDVSQAPSRPELIPPY